MFEDTGVLCEIEVRESDATTVVELRGELDLLAALRLGPALVRLAGRPGTDLVLDLRHVSFLDCAGIGMLCRVRNHALAEQGRFRLVVDHPFLVRTLRVLGLEQPLGVVSGHHRVPAQVAGETPR
ncbi:STAS domain-containing protein [Streptomyces sp. NPDC054863]